MTLAKIIAVEDERIVALHLKEQLLRLGFEVPAMAASGESALQTIAEHHPDLVLMDIHIEGEMDGIDTAAQIPVGIPVIYLTAYSGDATLERARATKPYGYLIKPYSERELYATIKMALERRDVESALRASEERFRSIFGAISEGILIIDTANQVFSDVNEPGCAMFGYATGELVGRDLSAIFPDSSPYSSDEVTAQIEKAISAAGPRRFDWQCRTRDGQLFWAEISLRLASIGGEKVVISVVRDLSERRAMEEQLRQAQKMEAVGQLTGGIAHDFNNLLGVIIGNLDLLRDAVPNDPELAELSDDALTAALGGAELTRRLLAFARRQPLQPQLADLNALISGTAKLLRRVLGENIEISLAVGAEQVPVIVDPVQFEAALTNLATNARDAMPGGGKLFISAAQRSIDASYADTIPDMKPGDYAVVEVTDTGVGMTAEVVSHIFEPFYTTKGRDHGTGLGLSMVFGFLKQSGGHVSVYSEVGAGTTFRLYLPSAVGEVTAPSAPLTTAPIAADGATVLVVEDNVKLRGVAVRQIKEMGYRVLQANDGAEALAACEAGDIDILFTDVILPGPLDGFELALTATERWPSLKVLLTSGFPETKFADKLAASGFRLLAKPYRKTDLTQILNEISQRLAAN